MPTASSTMASTISNAINTLAEKASLKSSDSIEPPHQNDVARLQARYDAFNQGHVFHFWDQLSDAEKAALYAQLEKFDPERVSVRHLLPTRTGQPDILPKLEPPRHRG